MSINSVFRGLLRETALYLSGLLLLGLAAAPLPARAEPPTITAQAIQRHVALLDARFKGRKPSLERSLDEGEGGSDISAWGTSGVIEKISAKYQGERGETLQDFYWQRGVQVAARLRRIDYGAYAAELPEGKPFPRNVLIDERFEFAGEALLRRRSFGRASPTGDASARSALSELTAGARSYKRLMDIPETKENKRGSCHWSCSRNQAEECLAYECK
jgi:hypothetical protein